MIAFCRWCITQMLFLMVLKITLNYLTLSTNEKVALLLYSWCIQGLIPLVFGVWRSVIPLFTHYLINLTLAVAASVVHSHVLTLKSKIDSNVCACMWQREKTWGLRQRDYWTNPLLFFTVYWFTWSSCHSSRLFYCLFTLSLYLTNPPLIVTSLSQALSPSVSH